MKRNVKLSGLILLGTLVVLAVAVLSLNREASPDQSEANKIVVMQPNTHILQDAGDGAPILVEFLDFECEACGAFYPYIEELKKEFETEITFAFRYFPLPGHSNAFTSALAVEAAAQQGKLREMFALMFETQTLWGESRESKAEIFRSYAERLGLDMDKYDSAIVDPSALQRITTDYDAGIKVGVRSTPTFFLNNNLLTLNSFDDVRNAIVAELGK